MIRTHINFSAQCDVPNCGRCGPLHNTDGKAGDAAVAQGWERRLATGTGWLYRCPKCVKAGKKPVGWPEK